MPDTKPANQPIIRAGTQTDLPQVLNLIKELAAYERAPDEVSVSLAQLEADYSNGLYDFCVADVKGEILGMSLYFYSYSTWKGKTLYLEDIIIKANSRRQGIGSLLFEYTLRTAHQNEAKRMSWQVLEWNQTAINFYKKYHAELDNEWINGRFTEADILTLVQKLEA